MQILLDIIHDPSQSPPHKTMNVAICCSDLDYQPLRAHISMETVAWGTERESGRERESESEGASNQIYQYFNLHW